MVAAMTTAQQESLFDLLFDTALPVLPYGSRPGAAPHSATSRAAADAIMPKLGSLQRRVLLALYVTPGLTCRALDRTLGTSLTRSAWPRVTELSKAGLIQQCGQCIEETGQAVSMWELTESGEALARSIQATAQRGGVTAQPAPAGRIPAASQSGSHAELRGT